MAKIIRLTESDLNRIVRKVIKEQLKNSLIFVINRMFNQQYKVIKLQIN